ncbi:MAG: hypothetical protein IPM55_20395 [Acidobacteria bacterium]|nr:hypothetical protein [Acidobacteriota bacterium]
MFFTAPRSIHVEPAPAPQTDPHPLLPGKRAALAKHYKHSLPWVEPQRYGRVPVRDAVAGRLDSAAFRMPQLSGFAFDAKDGIQVSMVLCTQTSS